jgi:tRNA (cmo5U34)-methyltransferase
MLKEWFRLMSDNGVFPEGVAKMGEAYTRDVTVLPFEDVRDIMVDGWFESPVKFFQAGMIHAWYAKRSSNR